MRAVDATLAALKRAGVNAIFGLPGGPVIPLFDALHDDPDIRTFLVRHEQGAGPWPRATRGHRPGRGRAWPPPGRARRTSSPPRRRQDGLGADRRDHRPGRPSHVIGTDAFQETPMVEVCRAITKHHYLVKDAEDIPLALEEAFHVAQTGRPGPVLVDVCVNQWGRDVQDLEGPVPPMPGYRPPTGAGHPRQLEAAARALARAERPVIYAGGGVITGEASAELTRLSRGHRDPGEHHPDGPGRLPRHPPAVHRHARHARHRRRHLRLPGGATRSWRWACASTSGSLSTVMSEWAPDAKIIHIDVDPAEISKNRARPHRHRRRGGPRPGGAWPRPTRRSPSATTPPAARPGWTRSQDWKRQHPYPSTTDTAVIQPQQVVQAIYRITRGDAIVTTGVGQHQMWAAQHYRSTARGAGSPPAAWARWASACRRPSAPRWPSRTSWSSTSTATARSR